MGLAVFSILFPQRCYFTGMILQLTELSALRAAIGTWHGQGESVALVPTMGALHEGHLHLVREAKKHAQRVVVSIFVNPTQFGPNEDFNRYPRTLEQDIAALLGVADAVWLPSVEEMYPQGFASAIHVAGVGEGLCGAFRPGHFDGVATVVAKLLLQVAPDIALFGEKDFQQLQVIKRMVADLNIPVRVMGVPTVREADGLALSSRNRYLSPQEREIAPLLHTTLSALATKLRSGAVAADLLEQAKKELLAAGFTALDYLELRAEEGLAPLSAANISARLLVAAWLGKTRLIDNVRVE